MRLVLRGGAVSQCNNHALTGGRCELADGHDGGHQRTYESGFTLRWTEESKSKTPSQGSRFD